MVGFLTVTIGATGAFCSLAAEVIPSPAVRAFRFGYDTTIAPWHHDNTDGSSAKNIQAHDVVSGIYRGRTTGDGGESAKLAPKR